MFIGGKLCPAESVRVQNILNSDKNHFRRSSKFLNKAMIKPIRARDVQVRHQIDLMAMGKNGVVKMNSKAQFRRRTFHEPNLIPL